jgi:hypothetical protein
MFIGNYLEPIAYLFWLAAVVLYGKRVGGKSVGLLRLYYSLSTVLMLTASLLIPIEDSETIWLYNIHAFSTVWMLGFYFRGQFQNVVKKKAATLLIAAASLYLLVKNLVLQEFHLFDSVGYSLVSASVVLYVLMYFHQLLNHVTDRSLFSDFNFWLTSAYLIYFLGSFIIFLTYRYFTDKILATYTRQERYILTNLWGLHNCLLFAGAVLLLAGSLWIVYREKSALS